MSSSDDSTNSSGGDSVNNRTEDKLLSMIHINAQSMRNKMSELEVEAEEHDIVAVSETWLSPEIVNITPTGRLW